jgi:ArsR family transcriptional regulator
MNVERLAALCGALGDPTRMRIFSFLRSCSCAVSVDGSGAVHRLDGPTVGEVCCHITGVTRATSTISFHLKELRQAGLIRTERRGKHIVCRANEEAIEELIRFLNAPDPVHNPDCDQAEGDSP